MPEVTYTPSLPIFQAVLRYFVNGLAAPQFAGRSFPCPQAGLIRPGKPQAKLSQSPWTEKCFTQKRLGTDVLMIAFS